MLTSQNASLTVLAMLATSLKPARSAHAPPPLIDRQRDERPPTVHLGEDRARRGHVEGGDEELPAPAGGGLPKPTDGERLASHVLAMLALMAMGWLALLATARL